MFGFAQKIGMTRLFINGKYVAVTVLLFPKQNVLQLKTADKDGYEAIQLGAFPKRNTTKPLIGHIQKATNKDWGFHQIGEFEPKTGNFDLGQVFDINTFTVGSDITISGKTKGRGFTGAVKRWGFKGGKGSHGHDHERAVGSIGSRWPQRVPKGKKMAGHSGNETVTVVGLEVVAIDTAKNLLFVGGSIAGANKSFVKVTAA